MNIFNPSRAIHRALRAREDSWLVFHSAALPANDALPANICRMGFALVRKGHHKKAHTEEERSLQAIKHLGEALPSEKQALVPPKRLCPLC